MAALVLALAAPSSWALGLGEIELNSALNEKLDAEIPLLDSSGLQPSEVIVSLASPEDYARVGVERFFFLTSLRFEVAAARGGAVVKVSSAQAITEPYLNFLVEVLWPNGRLLKEFTLLLDPPTYGQAAAPAVTAPSRSSATASAGRVERQTQPATQVRLTPAATPSSGGASALDEGVVGDEYRMTDREDTLWSIASRVRPSQRVTVQQTMLAIQRMNPQAFINDNINLLKAGYRLRLPSEADVQSVSNDAATAEVAQQNADWRAMSRGEQVADRAAPQARAAQDGGQPELRQRLDATPQSGAAQAGARDRDGELRIVAGQGDSASGTGTEAGGDLAAAREEQDRLSREVDELTYQLDREREMTTNQIAVKDRQLEVKDQQIAELQAQVAQMREQMDDLSAQQQTQSQNQNASQQASQAAWWQSPYVLGGAAGVVVLLLVYALMAARRRRSEDDTFFTEPEPVEEAVQPEPVAPVVAATAAVVEALDEPEEPATAVSEREETSAETADVIGEADIYIAYGRYPQAISLLLGALEDDSSRNDIRFKLLELYSETRDREAFDEQMTAFVEHCDDEEALLSARELAQQFADSGAESETSEAPAAEPAAGNLDEDDLLEFDTDQDADAAAAETRLGAAADDFELELDELESLAGDGTVVDAGSGDQLGGDLGIDFKLDDEPADAREPVGAAQEAADADEESVDFLLSGDDDEADVPMLDADAEDRKSEGYRAPASMDLDGEDEFDFGDEGDIASTKLDLARAYIDMGDEDGAKDILNEVLSEGSDEQRRQAQSMLETL
ncbi:MAG: FimV/HubP family polar landmark protein [Pseudomonadales bacterium]